jgi:hypothetical protein
MKNPWKLTSLLLALALCLVFGIHAVDSASASPEAQPRMRTALRHLRLAKDQLQRANTDKGGHRVKALELTDAAIDQVQRGIKFDNRHAAQ